MRFYDVRINCYTAHVYRPRQPCFLGQIVPKKLTTGILLLAVFAQVCPQSIGRAHPLPDMLWIKRIV